MTPPLGMRWRAIPCHMSMICLLAAAASGCGRAESAAERLPYPVAARGDVVVHYLVDVQSRLIAERADQWAFAAEQMGVR